MRHGPSWKSNLMCGFCWPISMRPTPQMAWSLPARFTTGGRLSDW